MEKFVICGGRPIGGTVSVSGAKNAVLPILAATILSEDIVTLDNVPSLSDIEAMCRILSHLGCGVTRQGNSLQVDARRLHRSDVPYALAGKLRGSFLVLGPLLARTGRAEISMPGGCAIGARPIDLHIKGLTAMGAVITNRQGMVSATVKQLQGANIYLDFPSVGATENILSAAVLTQGVTVIENAAAEPEIVDFAKFLCAMGARIYGAGTDRIAIEGVSALHGVTHRVMPDRIEAGTYLFAAAATGGTLQVTGIAAESIKPITAKLKEMGVPVRLDANAVTVYPTQHLQAVDVQTMPYPGFPTDMQAPMTALLSCAEGRGVVTETVFENRFMHAPELCRMGASIKVFGRSAAVLGQPRLTGAQVRATDLRAGAALVIAALAARGDTEISDIYHIDRGYEKMDEKLRALGAEIHRI